jgi:hypothetical protein
MEKGTVGEKNHSQFEMSSVTSPVSAKMTAYDVEAWYEVPAGHWQAWGVASQAGSLLVALLVPCLRYKPVPSEDARYAGDLGSATTDTQRREMTSGADNILT